MASGGCVFRRRHSAVEAGLAPLVLPQEWSKAHTSIPNHSTPDAARCLPHVDITCHCVFALSYLPKLQENGTLLPFMTLTDRIEPDVLVGCKICNSAVVCVEILAGLRAYVVVHSQSSIVILQDLVSGNALATVCSLAGKGSHLLVLLLHLVTLHTPPVRTPKIARSLPYTPGVS